MCHGLGLLPRYPRLTGCCNYGQQLEDGEWLLSCCSWVALPCPGSDVKGPPAAASHRLSPPFSQEDASSASPLDLDIADDTGSQPSQSTRCCQVNGPRRPRRQDTACLSLPDHSYGHNARTHAMRMTRSWAHLHGRSTIICYQNTAIGCRRRHRWCLAGPHPHKHQLNHQPTAVSMVGRCRPRMPDGCGMMPRPHPTHHCIREAVQATEGPLFCRASRGCLASPSGAGQQRPLAPRCLRLQKALKGM